MTREEAIDYLWMRGIDNAQIREIIAALSEQTEDAISRQEALDAMDALEKEDIEAYGCDIPEGFDGERAKQAINVLPSVQPIRQRGHWIRQTDDYHDYYECEHCGIAVGLDDIKNYCPNCGCAMVEP